MDASSRGEEVRRAIGIVAGQGGIPAFPVILGLLTPEFPAPILAIQDLPGEILGRWVPLLAERCPIPVVVAEDGQVPEPGKVYVAGGSPYLTLDRGRLRLVRREGRDHSPKDTLLRSLARELGPGAIAVVLSGMGKDGAAGLRAVRDTGGHTIAQDRATSLIFGIAQFAAELDAICELLPLREIAPRLLALLPVTTHPDEETTSPREST